MLQKIISKFFRWFSSHPEPVHYYVKLCKATGLVFGEYCARDEFKWEWIKAGEVPPICNKCPPKKHIVKKICKQSGLLASPRCPVGQIVKEKFVKGEESKEMCKHGG